eukprot:scaffold179357_cov19-Tisochrysis_lutea.AAC.2
MMIAATDTGNLRTYKYPLTGTPVFQRGNGLSVTTTRTLEHPTPALVEELTETEACLAPAFAGEFAETKCHQGSITRLRLSWDEQLVATASDDGSVFVHDVKDRDAKAAARREQVGGCGSRGTVQVGRVERVLA